MSGLSTLHETLQDALSREPVPRNMSLSIDRPGNAVELILDNEAALYGEWIKGEGADICLYRCQETNKVVGCRLPLIVDNLQVSE